MRTLRSETKGQDGACPDRTRAIPCKVRAVTAEVSRNRVRAEITGNYGVSEPTINRAVSAISPQLV